MGHLRLKANECGYKQKIRFKVQIINSISDMEMLNEINRELTTAKKLTKSQVSKCYGGTNEVEVQSAQKALLEARQPKKQKNLKNSMLHNKMIKHRM